MEDEGLRDIDEILNEDPCNLPTIKPTCVDDVVDIDIDKKVGGGARVSQFHLFRTLTLPRSLAEALQLSPSAQNSRSPTASVISESPPPSPRSTISALNLDSKVSMAELLLRPPLGHLLPPSKLRALASAWLSEDTPAFDGGGYVVGDTPARAELFLKSSAVIAGRPFVDSVFEELGCTVAWEPFAKDGQELVVDPSAKAHIATVTGPARLLLLGERVALNAMAECSAIASAARRAWVIARDAGWKGCVAGTRKTTPGFRLVQKYGMVVGGMDTHRMDLSSMVMLKDNHINVAGSIQQAVEKARDVVGFSVKIDVECDSIGQAVEAAGAGADIVMLDNFAPQTFREAAAEVKRQFPHVLVEGSGGITLDTIKDYMVAQADVLSFSVNRYVKPVDMSLKIKMGP